MSTALASARRCPTTRRALIPVLLAALGLLGARAVGHAADFPAAPSAGRPVVVELFTSQGCSSCPPADRLLARLGAERGPGIVPLAFHVDVWNSLGWNDPFSKRAWTERQSAYTTRLGVLQVTPQAIVNGRMEVVGADEAKLRRALVEAAALPAAEIRLTLEPERKSVRVRAEVARPTALAGRKLDLLFAVFETGLVTPVARGENGGRELHDEFVVRSLTRIARLAATPQSAATSSESESLPLAAEWRRGALGVAALVQDAETLEIVGAAALRLPVAAPG